MKHLKFVFFALAFVLSTAGLSAQNRQLIPYAVAFYNLENLFDTINNNAQYDLEYSPQGEKVWNSKKYYSKLDNMAYVISLLGKELCPLGPAVIGVSEVENRTVLEDLVKRKDLAKSNLQIVHYDSPDRRGIDVALLYNPLLFTVTSSQVFPLTIPDLPDFTTRDVLLVSGLMDGEKVHILVNHWPSRRGGEKASRHLRVAAAKLNKRICESLRVADPNAKVIIMGDLNDDPDNVSVRNELNAAMKKNNVKSNGLFNPMAELHVKGVGSLAYQGAWNLFDQIIISDNLLGDDKTTFKFWKAEIFSRDFLITKEGYYKGYPLRTHSGNAFLNGYSDHFPVLVYLVKYFQ